MYKREIELLAPAKDLESGKIAVDYGADAVYIGGPSFGARKSVGNTIEDIRQLVEYAHPYGVRVYAALNTLIYQNELRDAEKTARELVEAGVDALIIQDTAFLRMGIDGVEFHSSTQMCNTAHEQVRFLEETGFSRAILERGLTFEEIKTIRENTGIELECFVHGAICVGYSGQCYLSRSMGTRSGNRGDCAQPCRMTYDLVNSDGDTLISNKHLLSVMDLDLSARIPELLDTGITSFKIEGRLKEQDYLKNITSYYRAKIDSALSERPDMKRSSSGRSIPGFTPQPCKTFSRGSSEWMFGGKVSGVASFDTPKAIGAYIGKVEKTFKDYFTIKSESKLSAGDGICFRNGSALEGTNVNRVEGDRVYPNKIQGIKSGANIYRNFDHSFSLQVGKDNARRLIDVSVIIAVDGQTIRLSLTDEDGITATAAIDNIFDAARDTDKAIENIKSQVSRSGNTIFRITEVVINNTTGSEIPFVPASNLNALRRDALESLLKNRIASYEDHKRNKTYPQEIPDHPYHADHLDGRANITNSLAKQFYLDHGVVSVEKGYDVHDSLTGKEVMVSSYCIRRELGECLKNKKQKPGYEQGLFLKRGHLNYRLDFDCSHCLMKIVKL